MNADKTRNASLLFEAIGDIDDRLIQEAQAPFVKTAPSKRYNLKAIIALAATLSIVIGMLGAFAVSKFIGNVIDSALNDKADEEESSQIFESSLSQTLLDASDMPSVSKCEADEIDFFDGNTSIIWKASEQNEYCVFTLTSASDVTRLKNELSKVKEDISPENAENSQCEVWVTFGNGTVVSPYLKNSAGNVGYAELFEYSPEVEPDAAFAEFVNDLISD